jgi:hypothetical protein
MKTAHLLVIVLSLQLLASAQETATKSEGLRSHFPDLRSTRTRIAVASFMLKQTGGTSRQFPAMESCYGFESRTKMRIWSSTGRTGRRLLASGQGRNGTTQSGPNLRRIDEQILKMTRVRQRKNLEPSRSRKGGGRLKGNSSSRIDVDTRQGPRPTGGYQQHASHECPVVDEPNRAVCRLAVSLSNRGITIPDATELWLSLDRSTFREDGRA